MGRTKVYVDRVEPTTSLVMRENATDDAHSAIVWRTTNEYGIHRWVVTYGAYDVNSYSRRDYAEVIAAGLVSEHNPFEIIRETEY